MVVAFGESSVAVTAAPIAVSAVLTSSSLPMPSASVVSRSHSELVPPLGSGLGLAACSAAGIVAVAFVVEMAEVEAAAESSVEAESDTK